MTQKTCVHYGCSIHAPESWINFDCSPTLRVQRMPVLGRVLRSRLNQIFPDNVRFGDIRKGLPIRRESCDAIYASHVLEHLALEDCRKALRNSYAILKKGGIMRLVMPDLEINARRYVDALDRGEAKAVFSFYQGTLLGRKTRTPLQDLLGNQRHLWVWDFPSLVAELQDVGFENIRRCEFNDSAEPLFRDVEAWSRFEEALAVECIK